MKRLLVVVVLLAFVALIAVAGCAKPKPATEGPGAGPSAKPGLPVPGGPGGPPGKGIAPMPGPGKGPGAMPAPGPAGPKAGKAAPPAEKGKKGP